MATTDVPSQSILSRRAIFVRTGLVLTVIAFALVLILGVTYWRWLGYT